METKEKFDLLFDNFKEFMKEKNRRYGNSALEPCNIFSKVDAENSILIRLDDKLNRVMNSKELRKNDIADIFGYLSLLMISKDWITFDDLID